MPTQGPCNVPCDWVGVCLILRFRMEVHIAAPKPCSPATKNKTTKHSQNCCFLLHLLISLYYLVSNQMEEKRSVMYLLPQMPTSWTKQLELLIFQVPSLVLEITRYMFYTLSHADMPRNTWILRKYGWFGISVQCVLNKLIILVINSYQT